ncbi:MAG: TetR/AcrR family transcriptional regulator [Tissierella sp.]|nr:TetR/AcrR family transcriptional regulator [Tissierella sp.]
MKSNTNKRMSREERREQILKSALNIFIDKGYNGATTADISKEAGIAEVTLFRYFDSKKQIFMEAIDPILVTGLKESIVASKDLKPREEKLKFILKSRIKFISNHYQVIKLILMESQVNPEVANFDYINQTMLMLKDSIKEAGIELGDEDFSIRLLMGSILSFLYLPEVNEEKIDEYINSFIYTFLKNNK